MNPLKKIRISIKLLVFLSVYLFFYLTLIFCPYSRKEIEKGIILYFFLNCKKTKL